jgi:outer membrane protein assembly factor BamE (lipoprotein component of BamABCDE complex)
MSDTSKITAQRLITGGSAMEKMTVAVLLGAAIVALTACSASLQMVPPESQTGEKNLTLGSVQRAIQKGMLAAAVAEALGSPNIVTTDEQGREVWIYDRIATERVHESGYAGVILAGYARGTSVLTQRTLTVIVKFDADKRVRDYAYHAARF